MLSISASFWIMLGGAFGAWLRMWTISFFAVAMPGTPLGMAVVNLFGSFLIGFLYVPLSQYQLLWLKYCLLGGFLGSLTTFSTYALDVYMLIEKKKVVHAVGYGVLLPFLALVGVYLGAALYRKVYT